MAKYGPYNAAFGAQKPNNGFQQTPRARFFIFDSIKAMNEDAEIGIKEVVTQTILELFGDPDEGLELRDEIQERLRRSLAATSVGGETRPVQEIAAKLGLEW